jgi:hypothetical protein
MTAAALTEEVATAVHEIERAFPAATVTVGPDADGGAWVTVDQVDLGDRWAPRSTWLGFHIASTYPYADVYPHFLDASVRLAEGGALPQAVTENATFPGRAERCLQVSRRSNRWDPTKDTAASKAAKVIEWLRGR